MVVVLVVACGRLAEEGLHAPAAAGVQHDDLDDLLTLDERLGPQVGHADGGLQVLLEVEVVGRGARRRLQLRVLGWRRRPLLEERLPSVIMKGRALGTLSRAAELVRLKPVVN